MFVKIAAVLWIFGVHLPTTQALQKYYMEDDCGRVIDMNAEDIPSGRLLVTRRFKYRNQLSCYVTIVAPSNKRLIAVFRSLDIEFESTCDDDYVQLLDGFNPDSPLIAGFPERLCGQVEDAENYVTSGRNLTVYFKSDIQNRNNGFDIVFTAFYEAASCHHDELRCGNGRCIDVSLSCNGMDNCGDGSDECQVSHETIFAIILSVFLLTLIAIGLLTIYRKRQKRGKDRETASFYQFRTIHDKAVQRVPNMSVKQSVIGKAPSMTIRKPEVYRAPSIIDREPEVFCVACREMATDPRYLKRNSV